MAGSILELLEIAGPDAVRAQLEELPRPQRVNVVRAIRDSRYPARETLEDFRVLIIVAVEHERRELWIITGVFAVDRVAAGDFVGDVLDRAIVR